MILGLEFPPISHLVEWPDFLFEGTPFGINKVVLIYLFALVATLALFIIGGRKRQLVPSGAQNIAESSVDFIRNGVILQTMGPDGLGWLPFLLSMFFFIFFTNITGIIPIAQMPANARMAIPIFLALLVWVLFNAVGVIKQGPLKYLKNSLFPPGVPAPLYILVTPIEFVSTFLVRPFSLAVRLFANLLAGHILLVTFAVLSAALWTSNISAIFLPLPFAMLLFLTAVYIGGAMHPEH